MSAENEMGQEPTQVAAGASEAESTDIQTDAEAESAFAEAAAQPVKPGQPSEASDNGESAQKTDKAAAKPSKVTTGQPEPKPGTQADDPAKAARDAAEARAKEIQDEEARKTVTEEAERLRKSREDAEKASAEAGKASGTGYLDVEKVIREDLKDLKLTVQGEDGKPVEMTISDFEDDTKGLGVFGKHATSIAIAAGYRIAQRMVAPVVERLQALEQAATTEKETSARNAWYDQIAQETEHADVRDVVASKDFTDWYAKQSPAIQRLGAGGSTIKDNDTLLRLFKAETGFKGKAADKAGGRQAIVDKQRAARKDMDDLHRNTMRGNRQASNDDDFSEEEALKEFERAAKGGR